MGMHKKWFLFSLFFSQCLSASRTFFTLPVPFHPASPQRLTMTRNQMRSYINEPYNGLWVEFFGGRSTASDRLATYFFPFDKSCLSTAGFGSQTMLNHEADLIVHYFNVLTGTDPHGKTDVYSVIPSWTYESKLSISPVHSFWGLGFVYHRQLSERHDKGFWIEIALPVMSVKNDMHLCETIITPTTCSSNAPQSFFSSTGKTYQSMICALRSSDLHYGKIDAREYCQRKWGVPDLEAHIGYTFCRASQYHLSSYLGVLLPTGNKPGAEYLFEKIIGYNGHTGFFLGARGGINIWQHNQNKLSAELETSQTVFLDNIQMRSFDLYGKPWGRYIWVWPSDEEQSQLSPGINYFTRAFNVSHGSLRNLNIAATYNTTNFQGELGYHCYIRGEENLKLVKPWSEGPALAALWYSDNTFIGSNAERVSRSGATINEYLNITNDFKELSDIPSKENDTYIPVKLSQIDFDSAASPAAVMHSIYGSIGYGWYDIEIPTFINLAGAYSFGFGNTVLDHWTLWFKLGIAF